MNEKLPITGIFLSAYAFLFSNFSVFVRSLLVPGVAFVVVIFAAAFVDADGAYQQLFYLGVLLIVFVSAQAAVSVHRIVLLGADSVPRYGRVIPTKREARFFLLVVLGYASLVLFMLLFMTIQPTTTGVSGAATVVWGIGWLYFISRLLLLLPATALDRKIDQYHAWRISQGNGWRLLALLFVLPGLTSILVGIIIDRPLEWVSTRLGVDWLATIGGVLVHAPIFVAEIIMLSLAYQVLGKESRE